MVVCSSQGPKAVTGNAEWPRLHVLKSSTLDLAPLIRKRVSLDAEEPEELAVALLAPGSLCRPGDLLSAELGRESTHFDRTRDISQQAAYRAVSA